MAREVTQTLWQNLGTPCALSCRTLTGTPTHIPLFSFLQDTQISSRGPWMGTQIVNTSMEKESLKTGAEKGPQEVNVS